jgi:phosphoglycolate phosphatase
MYTVIFDLDGTLLDTLDDLTAAVNYTLAQHGLPIRTKEEVRSFVGNGAKLLAQRASGSEDTDGKLLATFQAYYKAHAADYTRPYDGVDELLQTLRQKHIQVGVLSNKPDIPTKLLIKGYFGDLVELAQGADPANGVLEKPCPNGLFALMARLGAKKDKTVYVGDSEVDIQTAKNAGIPCISVTWGFKDKAFLQANGANVYAQTPMDIIKLLEEEIWH